MRRKTFILGTIAWCCLAFYSKQQTMVALPAHFPPTVYDLDRNPPTPEKIELGRALFYDTILSKDSTISCASCHNPYNAFAHTDHDLSHGIDDLIGTRNAPALFNLAWQQTFMWDGAIVHLDMQALAPITNTREMNLSMQAVIDRLNASQLYQKLFYEAFRDSLATGEHALKALAQFQLTLVSANSKYDRVSNSLETFSDQESAGYALYQKNCSSCHVEPLFSSGGFANNGLPVDTSLNDYGKWKVSGLSEDSLLFKVPTLRNLSYTYPYMHDGRFNKLNQVLNHYTRGIQNSKTLSNALQKPILLSSNEKTDLLSFLLTLNDREFVFNPKHQFPKKILLPAKD